MKKKIFFIISAIIQILLSIILIVNAKSIVQTQINSINPETANEVVKNTISILQNKGELIVIVESIIIIMLNAFIFQTAMCNKILRRKGLMITATLISFFCSNHTIISLLCVINFIILICSQRKNPEDFPQKKEIPNLEYQKSTKKEKISAIILALVYFSQMIIGKLIPQDIHPRARFIIVVIYYLIVLITAILCFRIRLKRDIKLFKSNFSAYMRFVLPIYGLSILTLIISNMICLRITNQQTSVNQAAINSLPVWFSMPLAVIWAPIVEETVFRGVVRRFIKNDTAFIIISAILFGLIHTTNEVNLFNKIIMAIPYGTLGGYLAYMYAKSKNIMSNISAHCIHNLIASLIGLLV